ncbi:MAG: FprA family A-type flavoprotein [Bacteroidales bacterium]|nr:FprA family A-type flavoprotein [Bacteroidales bacterium]
MYNIRKIQNDLVYLGVADRNIDLFEHMLPTPNGMTYNSYLLLDKETVLFDTADAAVERQFFENLEAALDGRQLDYVVVHHCEPDHCALMETLLLRHPKCKIIVSVKGKVFLEQFGVQTEGRTQVVKEGDTLCTGSHSLTWVMAPMVHWPEVMVTFDTTSHILFSADAFGSFGAVSGNIFDDEVNYERDWLDDARRYYLNIVGKYGVQVQNTLKKAVTLGIKMICPLHGVVWRSNLDYILGKYDVWSSYRPEQRGVLILYASMYGNTESAVGCLATKLAERGVREVQVMNVSRKHFSYCLAAAFQWSHVVFACPSYNNGVYPMMETLVTALKEHLWQNRVAAVIGNGSWAPCSGKLISDELAEMKDISILENEVAIKSSLKESQLPALDGLADKLAQSVKEIF